MGDFESVNAVEVVSVALESPLPEDESDTEAEPVNEIVLRDERVINEVPVASG